MTWPDAYINSTTYTGNSNASSLSSVDCPSRWLTGLPARWLISRLAPTEKGTESCDDFASFYARDVAKLPATGCDEEQNDGRSRSACSGRCGGPVRRRLRARHLYRRRHGRHRPHHLDHSAVAHLHYTLRTGYRFGAVSDDQPR
jgi:hypothetical protein